MNVSENKTEKPLSTVICDAAAEVLRAADHLTNEYTRTDSGYGSEFGMKTAEEGLINRVQTWRKACRGQR